MDRKNLKCPKCGSTEVYKEAIKGFKTGDLVCNQCKYTSTPNVFQLDNNTNSESTE